MQVGSPEKKNLQMRYRRSWIFTSLILSLAVVLSLTVTQAGASTESEVVGGAEIGQPAPDFTLVDTDGNEVSLSSFKGKTVVLEWFNPDCPYVKAAYKDGPLGEMGNKIDKDKEKVYLAINSGAEGKQGAGLDRNVRARKEYKIKYPVLMDEAGQVGRQYGAKKTPQMYIIDAEGILRYNGALDNDAFAKKASKGQVVRNYVLLALAELEAGTEVTTTTSKPYGCSVKYGKTGQGGN